MKRNKNYSKTKKTQLLALIIAVFVVISGCKEDFDGYYDPPANLKGPLFEQLQAEPEFSDFVLAIEKLPIIKRAINTSGLYTIFAPTNSAIAEYLLTVPGKSKIGDFDMNVEADALFISNFVDKHIMYNMYFEYDFNEFIDENEDPLLGRFNNSNDVYRFWTRYREPKYLIEDRSAKKERLVRPSNHVVSIYTSKYINKYKMSDDYQSVFKVAPSDFNADGVQVMSGEMRDIDAKNGVIHAISKVLDIPPFMDNILKERNPYFHEVLENFSFLRFDLEQSTAESEDTDNLDSIFVKEYNRFGFNFASDQSVATVLCPSQGTFQNFVENEVLPGYYNIFDSLPDYTSNLLVSEYIIIGRKWESDIKAGVLNQNADTIIDPSITETIIASNGIVYVVDELLLSPAFKSVAKPVLVDKDYSWILEMMSQVTFSTNIGRRDLIWYLQNQYRDFTFFLPSNQALEDYGIDRLTDITGSNYFLYKGRKMLTKKIDSLLSFFILPDLALAPGQFNDLGFYPTRHGNYIGFDNGKLLSIDKNDGQISLSANELKPNGYVYFLDETPARPEVTLAGALSQTAIDSAFKEIVYADDPISKTDDDRLLGSVLASAQPGESYTLFVPTKAALLQYQADSALGDFGVDPKWTEVVQYLIVKTRIYSEGTFQQKVDNPMPDDATKFLTLHKKVIYDEDNIFNEDEYSWLKVIDNGSTIQIESEAGEVANIVDTYDIEAINGVIHHIDKVFYTPKKQYPDNQ